MAENQTHFVPLDPGGERTTLEVGGRGPLMGPVLLVEGSLSVPSTKRRNLILVSKPAASNWAPVIFETLVLMYRAT